MACPIRDATDFAAYLLEPDRPEWEPLRQHYPSCPECAEELDAWTRLEGALPLAAASGQPSHPSSNRLLVFHDAPSSLDEGERASIEAHLLGCAACRHGLESFAGSDAGELERAPEPRSSLTRPPRPRARWLGPRPILSAAALALLLLSASALLWLRSVEGPTVMPAANAESPQEQADPARSLASPSTLGERRLAQAETEQVPEAPATTPTPEAEAAAKPGTETAGEELEPAMLVAAVANGPSPVYVPPQRGAPSVRIGGGTRAGLQDLPDIRALAPEHAGLTVSASPTFYWFLSKQASVPVEFVLTDPERVEPVLEFQIQPPVPSGIHAVRLDQRGVVLEAGTAYRWFVSLVPDEARRSSDVIAGGGVQRMVPDAELEAQLASAGPDGAGRLYAERGVWYDALMFWSHWIEQAPGEPRLRLQRAALLEQAGLKNVATEERQQAEAQTSQ